MTCDDTAKGGTPAFANRRGLLKGAALTAATIAAPGMWSQGRAQDRRIVVRDSGGIFTQVYGDVFYKPFTAATGIEVVSVTSNAEPTTQIKGIVDTKSYLWDMASISQSAIDQLTREGGYIEKHELEKDRAVAEIPAEYMSPYGVGTNVYCTLLAYRSDTLKGKEPKSWADMWDVKGFPGRRGLRKYPLDTVEAALFASGVSKEAIYPSDLPRAFKALDAIKPSVSVWWTGGAQQQQLMQSGEVDLCMAWISRAQGAADAGAPVKVMWDQHWWGVDSWAIIKGTPKAELCREFIKFASDAKRQAALTPLMAAGPTNPNAYKFIDPKRAVVLPTFPDNHARGIKVDNNYWSREKDKAVEQFNAWLLT